MAREKNISQTAATAKEELFNKLGSYQMIDITKLEYNEGQIEGLPKNPDTLKRASTINSKSRSLIAQSSWSISH